MKYIKAILSLPFGIIVGFVAGVIGLVYSTFKSPVDLYNQIIYSEKPKQKKIEVMVKRDENGNLEMIMPDGSVEKFEKKEEN